ncbi:MAG: NADH-quinone oxidoreductase subunit C [Vicingaceae bacterium]
MKREELQQYLSDKFGTLVFPEIAAEILNSEVKKEELITFCNFLKADEHLHFDFLASLTALDWPEDMEVIYHLRSSEYGHELVLRVKTGERQDPKVDTVCRIWPTAEFHEREVFDLFGIRFNDHPDLRRIFLEDDWVGFPMRKDYEDEINMVEL